MMRYRVFGLITISVHTDVEAEDADEAREIAVDRGLMSLCSQCSSGDSTSEWVTSGELDCGEVSPPDGETELGAEEL